MPSKAFKKPPQLPPRFTATPSSLIADTKEIIEASRKLQDGLVKDVGEGAKKTTFEEVMRPVAWDENDSADRTHILCFYQAVSSSKELRDASTQAENLLNDFDIESAMREDVFGLVDAVFKHRDEEKLDPESRRLLEKTHKGYVQYGLGIPAGPKRDRFKEIKKRLSQLGTTFQKNLNEETGGLWFTREELNGVPADVISTFTEGEGDNKGKLRMSYKYPDMFPTLKYATNADVRQKVFVGNENKCPDNVPLFREAVLLRDEAARLLGYENHAAYKIEDKMAKTPKTVDDFLGDLRSKLQSGGKSEIEKLKTLKQEDVQSRGDKSDGHYYLWDHRYYDRLMIERDFSVDQQKIAEYFPLQTAVDGMLQIFEQLFGLVFYEITPGPERDQLAESGKGAEIVWHEDVQVFAVWDDEAEGGEFVGYLYLDMFPRDGKYGHAANFNLQPGYISRSGERHYPATALVCNFSKPTKKKPSLLKHDEVVTLFHELGHGIHDLVSRTHYSRFHGTSVVQDFVEAPSQMLENWCWTPSQLKSLSRHYSYLSPEYTQAYAEDQAAKKPGVMAGKPLEQMPDKLIESLIRTQHVNDALFNLRQLHFGIFDMTVHEPKSHAEVEALKISELYNDLRKQISGLEGPETQGKGSDWAHGQATFGHLIGGYDAGYYGYLSSQVYSADMFASVFKKDPMNGVEGRRYRHTVLERGGSQEEMKTLEDFLGRKPSPDAFYRELGVAR